MGKDFITQIQDYAGRDVRTLFYPQCILEIFAKSEQFYGSTCFKFQSQYEILAI